MAPIEASGLKSLLGSVIKSSLPTTIHTPAHTPSALHSLFDRARSTYTAVGWQTKMVQSFAILEVIHSLLGWVRSPVTTTAMQVASRFTLVWGIAGQYEAVSSFFLNTIPLVNVA